MDAVIGETVYRLRAELTVDGYGDRAPDWSDPARMALMGAAVAPQSQREDLIGRDATLTTATVYVRASALVDVRASDRMEVRGVVFDVDGEPQEWVSPFSGRRQGWVIPLKRVVG